MYTYAHRVSLKRACWQLCTILNHLVQVVYFFSSLVPYFVRNFVTCILWSTWGSVSFSASAQIVCRSILSVLLFVTIGYLSLSLHISISASQLVLHYVCICITNLKLLLFLLFDQTICPSILSVSMFVTCSCFSFSACLSASAASFSSSSSWYIS